MKHPSMARVAKAQANVSRAQAKAAKVKAKEMKKAAKEHQHRRKIIDKILQSNKSTIDELDNARRHSGDSTDVKTFVGMKHAAQQHQRKLEKMDAESSSVVDAIKKLPATPHD